MDTHYIKAVVENSPEKDRVHVSIDAEDAEVLEMAGAILHAASEILDVPINVLCEFFASYSDILPEHDVEDK